MSASTLGHAVSQTGIGAEQLPSMGRVAHASTHDRTEALAIALGTGKHARAALKQRQAAMREALERETGKARKPSLWSRIFPNWLKALSA